MRLIIPLILIALMLPYATGGHEPSHEWLIPPDPEMGAGASAVNAAAAPSSHHIPTTQPATTQSIGHCYGNSARI